MAETTVTVLVINCGSSSIKFAVIEVVGGECLVSGIAERLGDAGAELHLSVADKKESQPIPGERHEGAMKHLLESIQRLLPEEKMPRLVGHRVVHGAERFSEPVLVDEAVLAEIRACSDLAPLHNPANLLGIEVVSALFPDLPQVAVFDTAFHQTMPPEAYLYAIPYELYEELNIRRYGFHGTSHGYVANEAARFLGKKVDEVSLITLHLGNGCSSCAIRGGESVDTSMGLSPLEGMVMGTRSGDVDPDLGRFLAERRGMTASEVSEMLNRRSGLLGVSGISHDMRTLEQAMADGKERAALAIQVFVYRAAKSVLQMAAGLERLDGVVFTGGIGENAAGIRAAMLGRLKLLGLEVDDERNENLKRGTTGVISSGDSRVPVLVVPTNEELMIARESLRVVSI
ncbi:MAG: acetate/propionate family kinase [Puniceicoccaceae bacterium]